MCTDRGPTMHQLSRQRTDLVPSTRTGCVPTSYQQSVPIVYQPMFQSTVSVPLVFLSGQLRTNCVPASAWKLFLTCTINELEKVLSSYRLCTFRQGNHYNQILEDTLRCSYGNDLRGTRVVSLVALAPGDGSPVFYSLSGGFAHASDLLQLTTRGTKHIQ